MCLICLNTIPPPPAELTVIPWPYVPTSLFVTAVDAFDFAYQVVLITLGAQIAISYASVKNVQ